MVQRRKQGLNAREKRALVRILPTVSLLAFLLLALAPGCSLHSYFRIKKKTEELAAENKKLRAESVQLSEEINLLRHDRNYLEKIAREKYGLLRTNEEVYYVEPVLPEDDEFCPPASQL